MCKTHLCNIWGKAPGQTKNVKNLDQMSSMHGGQEVVKKLLENWPITGWCQAFIIIIF